MIRQLFLNNLKTALKHNHVVFNSPYNNDVLKLIRSLVEANLILNISKNNFIQNKRIRIYINIKKKYNISFNIIGMNDRKKIRTWPVSVLIKNAQRNQLFILKTIYGYKDSHFCIKKNIGGVTILKIEC